MCIPFQTIPPPTEGTRKAVKLLQYLAISQLVVILLKIVVVEDFGAFFELFVVFILYSAWAQLNHCSCVFYVLWCLYNTLMIFVIFGTRVQDGTPFFGYTVNKEQAASIVEFLLFFFYSGAAYVAFLAYKEFKILSFELSGQMFPDQNDQYQQPQQQNQSDYQQQQQAPQTIGYGQPSVPLNRQNPPAQPQGQGAFNAFQGAGVRIG